MAKLVMAVVAVMALVAMADAITYRTIITTTTVEVEGQGKRCPGRMQPLDHCKMYMSEQMRRLGMVADPMAEEEHLTPCCQQLSRVNEQCRCEELVEMVMQMKEGRQPGEMGEMMQAAMSIPRKCNMGPRECQVSM